MHNVSTRERDLISALRGEAASLKECFTRFTFQSITVSALGFGLIAGLVGKVSHVSLASIPLIGLLMAVCRIGAYKYAAANRSNGYELYLQRTRHLKYPNATEKGGWTQDMRSIGWEEALRAWRIVQPTIFRYLYRTPENVVPRLLWRPRYQLFRSLYDFVRVSLYRHRRRVRQLKDKFREIRLGGETPKKYPWFLLQELIWTGQKRPVVYYAGSYMRHMASVLICMQYLLALPLLCEAAQKWTSWYEYRYGAQESAFAAMWKSWFAPAPTEHIFLSTPIVYSVLGLGTVVVIALRAHRIRRRREMLESELLSIHSHAILWQAVVLAHYRALYCPPADGYVGGHYTERLVQEAAHLRKHVFRIHDWVAGECFKESS